MNDQRMKLCWSGPALDPSGYGEATRGYLMGLVKRGDIHVKLIPKYYWNGDIPDYGAVGEKLALLQANDFDKAKPYVFLQHLTPEQFKLGAGACRYHIGMTTFETDSIPATWQQPVRTMDEIWTFSRWGADVFRDNGIRRPITVVPHGVDVVRFRPGLQPLDFREKVKDRFVIGACFDWSERKNPRGLLMSYWGAFKPTDPVVLALKVFYQYPIEDSQRYVAEYIQRLKAELRLTKTPPILLLNGVLPAADLPRFYNSLDCYFLPSRGEGWGLTYSEAMACGLPTVAVNWSGQTEFMNDENSYLIKDFKLRRIEKADCENQPHYEGMRWADPNLEEAAHILRNIAEDLPSAKKKGVAARAHLAAHFTWDAVTRVVHDRLTQIHAEM